MAFNWLQFAVPHGPGPVTLSDIRWASLTTVQAGMYGVLVAVMLALTVVNLLLTAVFLKDLVQWLAAGQGYQEFMSGPPARITGIFVPIASLAMTMAVIFASAPFFIPSVAANIRVLVAPGLIIFGSLWLIFFALEAQVLRTWPSRSFDSSKLNFVWLLDVFTLGLLSLAGTGLASMADNRGIATIAAGASLVALAAGSFLLVAKLGFLIYIQVKSRTLPERQLQPAFFLVVPITCLYAISYYRVMLYLQKWFGTDIVVPSSFLIPPSYIIAAGWGVFTVYLLSDYFRNYFRDSEYFPAQWAMV